MYCRFFQLSYAEWEILLNGDNGKIQFKVGINL